AAGLSLLGGLSLGFPALMFPLQLLYVNLISDGVPALALGFTPRNEYVMKEKPEHHSNLLPNGSIQYILSVGIVASILIVGSYMYYYNQAESLARTAAFSILAII